MGFTQLEPFFGQTESQARYRMGHTLIDVLAPSDTTESELLLNDGTVTLAAPGGRRALEVSTPVTVYYGRDEFADFRVPSIGHAIVVKSAAVLDPRTAEQALHLEDVIEMLGALEQPSEWSGGMNDQDLNLLEGVKAAVATTGSLEENAALELLIQAIRGQD